MMRSTSEPLRAENFFSGSVGVQKLTPAEIAGIAPLAVMLWVMRHFMRIGRYEAAAHAAQEAEERERHAEH